MVMDGNTEKMYTAQSGAGATLKKVLAYSRGGGVELVR